MTEARVRRLHCKSYLQKTYVFRFVLVHMFNSCDLTCVHIVLPLVSLLIVDSFASDALRQETLRQLVKLAPWRLGCGFEGHLADHGGHLVVNRAAKRQPHRFLGTSWAFLGCSLALCWGILGPSWAQDGSSWAHLRPCWAISEPSWWAQEGLGRHLEAKPGLGSTHSTYTAQLAYTSGKINVLSSLGVFGPLGRGAC